MIARLRRLRFSREVLASGMAVALIAGAVDLKLTQNRLGSVETELQKQAGQLSGKTSSQGDAITFQGHTLGELQLEQRVQDTAFRALLDETVATLQAEIDDLRARQHLGPGPAPEPFGSIPVRPRTSPRPTSQPTPSPRPTAQPQPTPAPCTLPLPVCRLP